jgi:hypothetical protein
MFRFQMIQVLYVRLQLEQKKACVSWIDTVDAQGDWTNRTQVYTRSIRMQGLDTCISCAQVEGRRSVCVTKLPEATAQLPRKRSMSIA